MHTPTSARRPIQVTEFDDPTVVVDSFRGRIDNRLWSEMEADALCAAGISAYVRRNGCAARIAVYRGDPAADPKTIYVPTHLFLRRDRHAASR